MKQKVLKRKKTAWYLVPMLLLVFIVGPFLPRAIAQVPSQEKINVTGTVLDKEGMPMSNVSIIEKEAEGNSTGSDANGRFSIRVDRNSTLVFRYVGYKTLEISATAVTGSPIQLTEDAQNLDEVVVTGYTTQRKADLTGAVSVINVDQLRSSTSGNAMGAAQGKVAGMAITTNGSPNSPATVRIRGEGTLNNNNPLYIIDGTPTTRSMSELATMDIESIQVLKDASSASIYGSRAANGVIIITTRKGKKGTTVDFTASNTITSSAKPYELMNTEQRGIAQYWAIKNDNPAADPNEVGIGFVRDYGGLYVYQDHQDADGNWVLDGVSWREYLDPIEQTMRSADTDWQKEILRMGHIQHYNITLSSGTEKGNALFAADYHNNKGTIDGSFFRRVNARLNSDYSWLDGKVKIGENFTVSQWRSSANIGDGNLGSTKSLMSIVPVHTVDGIGWGGPIGGMSDRQNPVRLIEDNKQNHQDNLRLFGNAFVNVEVLKGLTFRSSFGVDFVGYWRKTMDLTYQSGFLSEDRNGVYQTSNFNYDWSNSNILQYVFDVNQHNFDFMVGQETVDHTYQSLWGSRRVFALETPDYMQLDAGEEDRENGGGASENTLISWFGKFNYNYGDRYLVSATLRRDASSVFGENNRWATFPAVSVGWVLNNESFMEAALRGFSQLKLRYGWGQNGNSQIDDYAAYLMYSPLYDLNSVWDWNWGTAYDFTGQGGSNLPSGFRRTQRNNPNLRWETTTQHNFGLDFAIVGGKFGGSIDYYLKRTTDILMKPGTVATLGEGAGMWLNGADIDNKGIELTLNYADSYGDVGLNVAGVFSHNKQRILKVPVDVINNFAGNGTDQNILGRSRSSMYGYVADGLFQSTEEVEAHATQVGAAPGRIRYKDLNDDGKIDQEDRTWLGNQDPAMEYGVNIGLTWNNFDFSVFLNGLVGKKLNVQGWKSWTDIYALSTSGENYGTRLLDAWNPTNTNTTIPAMSINNYNDEGRFSTYYVESGSYMKIRNIELGYSIPTAFLNQLKMNRVRFSLRADNVLRIKKTWGDNSYTGLDPETPGNGYPLPFSMTFAINASF